MYKYAARALFRISILALTTVLPLSAVTTSDGFTASAQTIPTLGDVTAKIERVGVPYSSYTPYARNAWDMAVFDNRLYVGGGNSANSGPSLRPGPMPVVSIDLASGSVNNEFLTAEDQVDRFRILDGKLVTPGHDPRESQDKGNFYTLEASGWTKTRTIPYGVHTYDMIEFGGKYFAALGTDGKRAPIVVSGDKGKTWSPAIESPFQFRTYNLFTYKSELYAASFSWSWADSSIKQLLKYDGSTFVTVPGVTMTKLIPDSAGSSAARMASPTEALGKLFYVGGTISDDHSLTPVGLYETTTPGVGKKVSLADKDAKAFDLIAADGGIYALTNTKLADGSYRIRVYGLLPGAASWTEVFNFAAPTLARSFTKTDDSFFVGLGTTPEAVSAASGTVYRVRLGSAPAVTPTPGATVYPTPTPTPQAPKADLNADGKVTVVDLSIMLKQWGTTGTADLNGDGKVTILDMSVLFSNWTPVEPAAN